MKLTAILLLAAALQVSANGYGQRITLTLKNASLEKTIAEIEKQSGFSFVYGKEQLAQARTIDLTVSNEKLESVLDLVFKDQPLTYTISGKYIAIRQKTAAIQPAEGVNETPPIDVHGRVVNDKGEPVESAIVTVKGTNKQVSTNANGEFTLTGIDGNATLVVSAVNIETYEIKVAGRTELAINVKAKVTTSDVVTVEANTGYQKVKPNEITGSVVVINNEQLNRVVSTDILSRLQGITPGLLFRVGNEGSQTSVTNIVIRGYSTIFSRNDPLIVVDNYPIDGDYASINSNISNINPNDIESITILKDAAATSIWGVRGSNGVIVITTKSGKYNQPPKVSLSSNISFQEKPDLFSNPILNTSDFIDLETFLFKKDFYASSISSPSYPALTPAIEILLNRKNGLISAADSATQLAKLKGLDFRDDLLKYYYQKNIRQQYNVNVSGGGANQQYYISLGYDHNTDNLTNYGRYSINANNTYALFKRKLEFTVGIAYSQTRSKSHPSLNTDVTYPYAQLADENGNPLPIAKLRQGFIDTAGGGKLLDWSYYPLKDRDYFDLKTSSDNQRFNAGLKYKMIKGLDISVLYQFLKQNSENQDLYGTQTYFARNLINLFTNLGQTSSSLRYPVPNGGVIDLKYNHYTSQNLRGQINYSKNWRQYHHITAFAGAEVGSVNIKSNQYRVYGYNDENGTSVPVDFINTYPTYLGGSSTILNNLRFTGLANRSVSFYSNAAYSYKERYILSASIRKDGANIFGTSANNKWRPLWSVGGSWEINKESFFSSRIIDKLKLRTTYGYQGNISPYSALLTINNNSPNQYSLPTADIMNPPNPDLRWEKTGQLNIGLDYSILNNRIWGSIEYYQKRGVDIVGLQLLAPSIGYPTRSVVKNSADMKARGWDIIINSKNITGKSINWTSSFYFSYSKDWVTDYKLPTTSVGSYVGGGSGINPIIGRPVNAVYSYKWAGLDPINGDPLGYLNKQISKNYTAIQNSKNLDDLVYNGPSVAPYFGSLLNTINWKNLSVSFNIIYKLGYYFRRKSIDYYSLFYKNDRGHNDYKNRWQQPGDELYTNVPSLVYPTTSDRDLFYNRSEVLVEKGDHIRFQDISINYDLSRQQISRLPVSNIRLSIYLSNLGIIWKANKAGIDPDYVPLNDYTSGMIGKTISFKLKVDF